MNVWLFILIVLLFVALLCAAVVVAAAMISSRSVKQLTAKYPTIYAEDVLAKAHSTVQTPKNEANVSPDSSRVMVR